MSVHVYAGSRFLGSVYADQARPDVDAVHHMGANHGFNTVLQAPAGTQDICVYAINVGPGATNPSLGCRRVNIPT